MTTTEEAPGFTRLPDLAVRSNGGSVIAVTDDTYGERENLIRAGEPEPATRMATRGWAVDAWETRRRRTPGRETAVVRLGMPGSIAGITVDTTFAGGGYPPEIEVEAVSMHGYPTAAELDAANWTTIVAKTAAGPHQKNHYGVSDGQIYTHVRLHLYPDGNVARLRVHGIAVPDLRPVTGVVDLAALAMGAYVLECSGAPQRADNALSPGRGRTITEGWETSRNRSGGHDFLRFRLGAPGRARFVEIDTLNYFGNSPGRVRVLGRRAGEEAWREVVPLTEVIPDARQLRRSHDGEPIDEVMLETYPDGGITRVRVLAELDESERAAGIIRWFNLLPAGRARAVLVRDHGVDELEADAAVAARPIVSVAEAPEPVKRMLADSPWSAIPA